MLVLNIFCLSIRNEIDDKNFQEAIRILLLIFNIFFFIEKVFQIKLVGVQAYFKDLLNVLQVISIYFGSLKFYISFKYFVF